MTLASWPQTFAGGRDEDEVLVEWLRANYATLSTAEKRKAVKRLHTEWGYTDRGLGDLLGVPASTVRHLRASDEELERHRLSQRVSNGGVSRISGVRVRRLADAWQDRASKGLSPREAVQLLDEFRALVPDHSA
ncbi:hypothetical protein C8D88_11673 [Lentzea atacamensis]|uniref:Antitoxin Xre-like helix-turn-helix domain-containing protein n=1 Tax=Lentzea atacamensis TaxID=531938 RepID=A0A316HTR0_9PSEU|nr:antitoxin Xre-like helix-turn-helix domain-containing protein [Lentzea atacamensis]PWK81662.1 hypothetical protein C8D88_11673 [Lentzea atacamensis]